MNHFSHCNFYKIIITIAAIWKLLIFLCCTFKVHLNVFLSYIHFRLAIITHRHNKDLQQFNIQMVFLSLEPVWTSQYDVIWLEEWKLASMVQINHWGMWSILPCRTTPNIILFYFSVRTIFEWVHILPWLFITTCQFVP